MAPIAATEMKDATIAYSIAVAPLMAFSSIRSFVGQSVFVTKVPLARANPIRCTVKGNSCAKLKIARPLGYLAPRFCKISKGARRVAVDQAPNTFSRRSDFGTSVSVCRTCEAAALSPCNAMQCRSRHGPKSIFCNRCTAGSSVACLPTQPILMLKRSRRDSIC